MVPYSAAFAAAGFAGNTMNVLTLHLKNFKRFTDLRLDLSACTAPPKLVLLIGANGSGKSSVFDAFEFLTGPSKGLRDDYLSYFGKQRDADISVACTLGGDVSIRRTDSRVVSVPTGWDASTAFYGRSSFRTVPELAASRHAPVDLEGDSDRPQRFIEQDTRFATDVAQITEKVLHEIWGEPFDSETMKARYVDPINEALERVFSTSLETDLRLRKLIPALSGKPPDIRFRKGISEVHYDLLSSGEKEVFNIILNLFSRREHFSNAIYFIDELDVHLHTSLQYALVKEIVEHWIPENSQLWTASHSLGFIDYANGSDDAAILDFDDLDFDQPQTLSPAAKSERVFDIAVPRSSALKVFPNKRLIICENSDAGLYNAMDLADLLFIGARDKNSIVIQARGSDEYRGLIDRDFLGTAEIAEVVRRHANLHVLGYYAIENYLYHPDNLAELDVPGYDDSAYRAVLRSRMATVRDRLLVNLRGSRGSYEIVRTFSKELKEQAVAEIKTATSSDDLETFYPFLDMKKNRPTAYLARFNLRPLDLAATRWMCAAIAAIVADRT